MNWWGCVCVGGGVNGSYQRGTVFRGEVGVGEITADGQSQRYIPQQNADELLPFSNRNGTFWNLMLPQSRRELQILADVKWVHAQQPTIEHFKGSNRAAASRCVRIWEFTGSH